MPWDQVGFSSVVAMLYEIIVICIYVMQVSV